MPQIVGFSPRVYEEVGRFFAEHPVVVMDEEPRDADFGSRTVKMLGLRCEDCAWEYTPSAAFWDSFSRQLAAQGEELRSGYLPIDFLRALHLKHAWDQASRSHYCGGRMAFITAPVG